MLTKLYRQAVLGVSGNPVIANLAKKQGWKLGVGRFVAGEDLEEAIPKMVELESRGLLSIFDLLGEFINTEEGANEMTEKIIRSLERLGETDLNRYMSVKPTQMGLGVSLDLALENGRRIMAKAQEVDAHICLDMENAPFIDPTLQLLDALLAEGYSNVSTVLQSYMRRSMADLKTLLSNHPGATVRIVKGAYKESPEVAYQDKDKVDANYREMVWTAFDAGAHVNVASHDESIINEVIAYTKGANLGKDKYEFQLLYGVKPKLQERLVAAGHTVRIYVPYGKDWYGYFSRRLAERPANLMFVLRGLAG